MGLISRVSSRTYRPKMADCLTVLREWTMEQKCPQEMTGPDNRTLLVFGDFAWPKSARTNYRVYTHNINEMGDYYTLESIYFLLSKVKLPHTAYVREANAQQIPVVKRPDRNELLNFLRGS